MMSPSIKIKRGFVAIGAVLIFGGVNALIAHKESIKRNGEVVYLDLAPVDPRSLMQGDYMTLNFDLARRIESEFNATGGGKVVKPLEGENRLVAIILNERRVASLSTSDTPFKIRYRLRDGRVWLGTNAFFFEEGRAAQYAQARYGEFRLDKSSGEAVLVGLRTSSLAPL